MQLAVIEIGIDPMLRIGGLSLAWHGITVALGIGLGTAMAVRYARTYQLDTDEVISAVLVIAFAGLAGARIFFFVEQDPGGLIRPDEWFGSRGYAFYGAILFGVPAVAFYLKLRGLGIRYLDALAFGFPVGMAVGRIGDLINGEHHGPASDLPWAIRYTHPDADVPSPLVAYHSGGLYEIVLALLIGLVVFAATRRATRRGMVLWLVVGLYGAGRFVMFFYRSDSDSIGALTGAQWTSLGLVAVAATGALIARRRKRPAAPRPA